MNTSAIYVLRRNEHIIGFADNNRPYLIGFTQQTHAYLVKRNITQHPVIRVERDAALPPAVAFETQADVIMAKMSVLKDIWKDDTVFDDTINVTRLEMEEFLKLPLLRIAGIALPTQLMEDDDEAYTFACQIVETESLP